MDSRAAIASEGALDELCDSCRTSGLAALLDGVQEMEISQYGEPLLSLGRRPAHLNRVACASCRFFLGLSTEYKRKYRHHLRLFNRLTHPDPLPFDQSTPAPFLSVVRENSRLRYDWVIKDEIIQPGVLAYNPEQPAAARIVHEVDPARVNYKVLAQFLSDCQEQHAQCNLVTPQPNPLRYIKLIDCLNQTLVTLGPMEQRYCCLSYVWGDHESASQFQETAAERFLVDQLPPTIRDSMQAVVDIGLRYLWVDRYCIDQGDPDEKKLMLRNMDQIYENADLTIVSLYGNNDRAGLPGVSDIRRVEQSLYKFGTGSLLFSCPAVSNVITESNWATRGWTYQEARLSRRCLFFSKHQVYFVCKDSTRSEAVRLSHGGSWVAHALNSDSLADVVTLFGGNRSLMDPLLDDRLMFSQRTLTYESDILDAFRGILTRSASVTLWGVPIMTKESTVDPSKGLALGMTWSRRPSWLMPSHLSVSEARRRVRRTGFPTWSWAGVVGEAYVIGADSLAKNLRSGKEVENIAHIKFSLRFETMWASLGDYIQKQSSNILPETLDSQSLLVEGDILRIELVDDSSKFRISGIEGNDHEAYIDLDTETRNLRPPRGVVGNDQNTHDALVLFVGRDSRSPPGKRGRMILILLLWVADDRAERWGLLSNHVHNWNENLLQSLPTVRKTFVLQ